MFWNYNGIFIVAKNNQTSVLTHEVMPPLNQAMTVEAATTFLHAFTSGVWTRKAKKRIHCISGNYALAIICLKSSFLRPGPPGSHDGPF